jgi:hypothetical protein
MAELYRIKKDGEIIEVKKASFSDEPRELEDFVMKNERIFGNVAILNHQISTPDGNRIDIWGLDTLDMRPVIIELKNTATGIEIIPQILPYYNFVKSNPDTLKFNALSDKKFMEKLKALEFDENKLSQGLEGDPKVILIAPVFNKELLDVVAYIRFSIELIEISRYKTEDDFLVTINKPQITTTTPVTVRVMEEWDWQKYKTEGISEKKINIAQGLKEKLDEILKREKIELQSIFRKLYIPYQSGRNNIFYIDLLYTSWTTGDVRLSFKGLDKEPDLRAENIEIEHTKTKWFGDYEEWSIFFDKVVDLSPLTPIIKRSYENITGAKIEE